MPSASPHQSLPPADLALFKRFPPLLSARYRFEHRALLLSVTDSDTLLVMLDQGVKDRREIPVRVAGVAAPELDSPVPAERALAEAGRDAAVFLMPPGRTAMGVESHAQEMTFARLVGDITLPPPDGTPPHLIDPATGLMDYGAWLVDGGYAVLWSRRALVKASARVSEPADSFTTDEIRVRGAHADAEERIKRMLSRRGRSPRRGEGG